MVPIYLDQIDAEKVGYEWLHKIALEGECDEIRPIPFEYDGRYVVAFKNDIPYAFFAVIRSESNYSFLYKNIIFHIEEIQPCPFCGSKNVSEYPGSDMQAPAIYCDECPAGLEDTNKSIEELKELWNKRYYC